MSDDKQFSQHVEHATGEHYTDAGDSMQPATATFPIGLGGVDLDAKQGQTSMDIEEVVMEEDTSQYLDGWRLVFAVIGMMCGELITGLGGNMLSPAFETIVETFDAASSFGWVGALFYMTQAPCMLLYGQILSHFDGKWVFMTAVGIFLLGSIVCGSAQNITAVILGRAISGIGAAGIWVGVLALVSVMAPLKKRPAILGIFGLVNAFSSGVGPVLAGYFADSVSWRLCFLFILPVGAVSLVVIYFSIPNHQSPEVATMSQASVDRLYRTVSGRSGQDVSESRRTYLYRFLSIDWIGFLLVMLSIICMEIALQWGGTTYAWGSATIISLFVVGFGGTTVAFVCWSAYMKERALMPVSLWNNRTQVGACLLSFFTLYMNLIGVIMLPYFFEVVLSQTATQAGYNILPYLLFTIACSLAAGLLTTRFGYYWPFLIIGPIFTIISGALYFRITEHVGSAALYGYQLLLGVGVGLTQQQIYVCIQAHSAKADVHRRIAIVSFTELFGGAVAPTVSIALLSNTLTKTIAEYAPDAPASVLRSPTLIGSIADLELRAAVVHAYMKALNPVFGQLMGLGAAALLSAMLVKNINVKKAKTG